MTAQTAEPTPLPEWALERAQNALCFLAPCRASKYRELRDDVAAALVAVRREAIEELARWIEAHVTAPRLGELPAALRALADKEPT